MGVSPGSMTPHLKELEKLNASSVSYNERSLRVAKLALAISVISVVVAVVAMFR